MAAPEPPPFVFTDADRDLYLTLCMVSCSLSLPLLCTNLFVRERRQFPTNLISVIVFSAFLFNLNIGIALAVGYEKYFDAKGEGTHWCRTQAVLFQFVAVLLVCSLLLSALTIYMIAMLSFTTAQVREFRRRYALFLLSVPTVLTAIPLVWGGVYGPDHSLPFCWMTEPEWKLGTLFLIMAAFELACFLWGPTLISSLSHRQSFSSSAEPMFDAFLRRQLFMLFGFNLIFACGLLYALEETFGTVTYTIMMLNLWTTGVVGMFIALVYGPTYENFELWRNALRRLCGLPGLTRVRKNSATEGYRQLNGPPGGAVL